MHAIGASTQDSNQGFGRDDSVMGRRKTLSGVISYHYPPPKSWQNNPSDALPINTPNPETYSRTSSNETKKGYFIFGVFED
jgi:hypothetical protein